ncbi:MAG: beta-N-acetylglucosaminidase domain-containing protein [Planctomycetes bacterium]|nr:beta-N-acetylglucosaminidase domain-containing protein [Planctomycetota bacterium]
MNQSSLRIYSALLLLGAGAGFASAAGGAAGDNLVANPGFEVARWNAPAAWRLSEGAEDNTFDWISGGQAGQEVHSGARSLRMNALRQPALDRSMDATTNPFRVLPYARVEASVWLKARDVATQEDAGGYGLRVTLTARSASGVKIEHRDLMNEQGSFSWKKIQGGMIVPEGTVFMDLSIKMTTCTGTVWIDDAQVRVVEELPTVNLDGFHRPVVIPRPWQSRLSGDKFELRSVSIMNQRPDPRIREAVASLFTSIGIVHEFLTADSVPPGRYATQLILGDSAHPALSREFYLRFPQWTWADLEEQGYFLAVVPGAEQNLIYLGANSPSGRFYAVGTLKQLIQNRSLYVADILDKPTVACRGIPMGLQWFEQREGEALRRMTQLKLNFVWAQGSFLNDCLSTDNWRLDFTPAQKAAFQEFIELYQKNFIDVWIAFGPRGKNPPLQYSSAADIDTLVHKMEVLYTLGLRNFGLRFDDLGNVGEDRLLVPQDISAFNDDIGAAQVYFIYEVYSRLKSLHPDIKFMVVPLDYNQTGNHRGQTRGGLRLRQYRKLPADIGIYSVSYYDEDILAATCLTGRPTVAVVSNFYSEGIEDRNEYAVPFVNLIDWQDSAIRSRIAGFTWLPKIPQREDAALISWRTAADFAWAPERYDPQRSFQRAAAQYLGVWDEAPVTSGAGLP